MPRGVCRHLGALTVGWANEQMAVKKRVSYPSNEDFLRPRPNIKLREDKPGVYLGNSAAKTPTFIRQARPIYSPHLAGPAQN